MSENITKDTNTEFLAKVQDYRGWDLASESYRIGDAKWQIQKHCKTPANEEILRELSNKIIKARNDLNDGTITSEKGLAIGRDSNKKILEMTLLGFQYDIEAEKYGHRTLGEVSLVMQAVFLIHGGWEELIFALKQNQVDNKQQ